MAEEAGFIQKQLDGVKAKIQAEVGTFLQLKNRIQPFRMSADPAVAQEADRLFRQQEALEGQLEGTMTLIKTLQAGGTGALLANIDDIYQAYGFVNDLKDHKDEVNLFEAVNQGKAPAYAGAGVFDIGLSPAIALSAVAGLGYYLWKGRK